MKRKILFVLLLLMPFMVSAKDVACDYTLFVEYQKAAMNIDYETSYSIKNKTFTVTFYNIINGIYLSYNGITYSGIGNDNQVTINDLGEGQTVSIMVNTNETTCSTSLRTIQISLSYYNTVYDNSKCDKYRNKLTICKSKFLNYKPTEDLLDSIIENYNNSIPVEEPDEPDTPRTFLDDIKDFTINYGIQILLIVVSSTVTILIFNAKLRKIKHGI